MRKILEKYLNAWLAFVAGIALGMCIFSLLLQAPNGLENWLSALGTILAVVVSLYLANRDKTPGRLNVYDNTLHIALNQPKDASEKEVVEIGVSVYVSNTGEKPLLITNARCIVFNETIDMDMHENILLQPGDIEEVILKKDISDRWYVGKSMLASVNKSTKLEQEVQKQLIIMSVVGQDAEKFNFEKHTISTIDVDVSIRQFLEHEAENNK